MSKDPISEYFMNAVRIQALIHTGEDIGAEQDKSKSPYGEWCRDPKACAGKGYCPLDPTCGD